MVKFEVNEHGVWWTPPRTPKKEGEDEDEQSEPKAVWIAPPIRVEATIRNAADNDHHGQFVRFKNQDGIDTTCTLELAELAEGNEAITKLLNLGFKPSRKRHHLVALKDYLYNEQPTASIWCVPLHGWHGKDFIETDHYELLEGSSQKQYVLDPATAHGHRYNTAGTLEDWKNSVARLCDRNSRPALAICAAFAAPLLHLVKAQNIGLHLRGISSTGKTTTLFAAGSVWGGSEEDNNLGFVESWRATANGLELQCALHNDSLLCLDEISLVNDREIGDIVYSLGNGTGKRRATRDIKARPVIHFRLVFLSCGERSLKEMMETTGKRVRGGQESRLIDIPADVGKGYGIFEELHGHPDGASLSNCLTQAAKTYYGTAGRAWIDYLKQDPKAAAEKAKALQQEFISELHLAEHHASGEISRVAQAIGLLSAAGEMASEAGITGWEPLLPANIAKKCFDAWIRQKGGYGAFDIQNAIEAIAYFIEQNPSRFQNLHPGPNDKPAPVYERAGFYEDDYAEDPKKDEPVKLYYFFTTALRQICAGNHIAALHELKSHQQLVADKDRLDKNVRIPQESCFKRLYAIKSTISAFTREILS